QFGYKPATNSTMLTVEPQATQITQLTKHQNNYNMKQNRTENMCICFKAEASALGLKASSQIRRLFLHHRLQTILR
ncbi:hypothetical protein HXY32_07615, partial [Candidatus Bathyarchaeota archaeon]|nr:hypothetical protein [Candidatus Bathyarchaeota archaeon]